MKVYQWLQRVLSQWFHCHVLKCQGVLVSSYNGQDSLLSSHSKDQSSALSIFQVACFYLLWLLPCLTSDIFAMFGHEATLMSIHGFHIYYSYRQHFILQSNICVSTGQTMIVTTALDRQQLWLQHWTNNSCDYSTGSFSWWTWWVHHGDKIVNKFYEDKKERKITHWHISLIPSALMTLCVRDDLWKFEKGLVFMLAGLLFLLNQWNETSCFFLSQWNENSCFLFDHCWCIVGVFLWPNEKNSHL